VKTHARHGVLQVTSLVSGTGGAAGYGAHTYRNEIADGANSAWRKALAGSNKLKVQARHSVLHVTALVNGTGGTTESKKDLALSEGVA